LVGADANQLQNYIVITALSRNHPTKNQQFKSAKDDGGISPLIRSSIFNAIGLTGA